jgi:GNAT superfamily N-acetyltransferase
MALTIREADRADAAALASLSGELGYPVSREEMEARLDIMARVPEHAVLVACEGGTAAKAGSGRVIGWVDVGIAFHLQSGRYGEIGGLVVTGSARGKGAGKALVAEAETWAAAKGARKMLVRSNAIREDAHRFYLRESYIRSKTSAVFEKPIGGPSGTVADRQAPR